jgi:outer membrane protein OmpA-like peptidoglycan-associated protein
LPVLAAHNLQPGYAMSGAARTFAFALMVGAVAVPAPAMAQRPGTVRVVDESAPIRRWFRVPITDVLVVVDAGTTLDVLDEERGWYWVVAPPDAHGTRRAGWIRVSQVEPVVTPRGAAAAVRTPAGMARTNPPTGAAISFASVAEDKVTITMSEGPGPAAGGPASAYTFDDVHFDRDRYAVRSEDHDRLRAVVAALKADPRLTVSIEGYTCNLGSPAYNLALGNRRANAVRDYLASQGAPGDRLHTVSVGEDKPKHDNASEETRRLNRRVGLVPNVKQ